MFRIALLALCLAAPAAAQEAETAPAPNTLQLEDYLDFETVSDPQISPDGSQVLYTRTRIDKLNDKRVSTQWLVDRTGTRTRQLMEGSGGVWSPDGDRIAFVKPDENGKPQIYVRFMDAEGLVTQVTAFEHPPRALSWSPDGRRIAFIARTPLKETWSVDLPGKPAGAKWTEDPAVIDTLHYRQDRVGYTNTGYDHLFVVPATGGTPRQLTDGEWNVGRRALGVIAGDPKLSWSRDGRRIAFDGPGEGVDMAKHWYESHIHLVDVRTGARGRLTEGHGSFSDPAFSPDGSKIAFSGYPEHDASYPVPKLYVMNADGSEKRILADDLPDGPQSLHWTGDSREVLFTVDDRGARNLHAVGMAGEMREVTRGPQVVDFASLSRGGTAAITLSTADAPPEVALASRIGRGVEISVLTSVNADVLHGKTLGRVEEFWTQATAETGETADVQGWVVLPPDYDPAESYPLMLSIHGGPHAMYNTGFNFTFQEFAARGYVVVYVNPRGSTGYGSAFANAIQHRYPGPVDYADLMAGVDAALAKGYGDPNRMFVTGCSGGGVLTTWVIGQTDRFKGAAALCPVVNWIGMSGTTDVAGWLYNFFPEPFWENPEPWLAHSSIMHVGKVTTPTLLMTGREDLRTPLGEAEEYFSALKMRGVPTRLVPMNGESHGTRSIPSNYLRTSLMMRKWFAEYDPGPTVAPTPEAPVAEDVPQPKPSDDVAALGAQ